MSNSAAQLLHPRVVQYLHQNRWKALRFIQEEAIRLIHETDDHLLITASTAGGKTEAAFLPIVSELATLMDQTGLQSIPLGALYVGPLKALINDQFRRVEDLCTGMEIPVHRWHGDVEAGKKKAFRRDPQGILLITPESVESNFINYGDKVPAIYQALRYIVIDEFHSFLGNVRGIHLLSLLCRLTHTTGCRPRIIGLSATLGGMEGAGEFLRRVDGRGFRHVDGGATEGKAVKLSVKIYGVPTLSSLESEKTGIDLSAPGSARVDSGSDGGIDSLVPMDRIVTDLARRFRDSKNLIFVNSRRTAESLTLGFREHARREGWTTAQFEIHHGSISRQEREDVEGKLSDETRPVTVVCSSTLEMGINFKDIRAVAQVDPPWSVSSLRQRLGRSGREEGQSAVLHQFALGVVSEDPVLLLQLDLVRCIALIELMIGKWLEPSDLDRRNLSTLVFQILSMLRQTGGCGLGLMFDQLCRRGAFSGVAQEEFISLMRHLAGQGIIEQTPGGQVILTPDGELLTQDKGFYAAFSGDDNYIMRHNEDVIGELPRHSIPPPGQLVILAAQRWRVDEVDHVRKLIWVVPAKGGSIPRFSGSPCSIHSVVAGKMCDILVSTSTFGYLHSDAADYLASARRSAAALRLCSRSLVRVPRGTAWFPWTGTEALLALALLAAARGLDAVVEELHLVLPCTETEVADWAASIVDRSDWAVMLIPLPESLLRVDKYDEHVPDELLEQTVFSRRLDLPGARAALRKLLAELSQ